MWRLLLSAKLGGDVRLLMSRCLPTSSYRYLDVGVIHREVLLQAFLFVCPLEYFRNHTAKLQQFLDFLPRDAMLVRYMSS